jgi:hypothetical protein
MKKLMLILCLGPLLVIAQPSEATVKKDLTNENTIKIDFTKTTGTRQWNASTGNWEYVRGVKMLQKSFSYPAYKVIIEGDAVYQDMGGGKYSYWKFRTTNQYFEGIPNLTKEAVHTEISKDWQKFYGADFKNIVKLINEPQLIETAQMIWHSPLSVSFQVEYTAEIIAATYYTETRKAIKEVRLYRSDVDAPWEKWLVSKGPQVILSKNEYSEEQINRMRKSTLAYKLGEELAKQALDSLPGMEIPVFETFEQLTAYAYDILRNKGKEELRYFLIQTLHRDIYFVKGSQTQLNARGEQLVNQLCETAFAEPLQFKDEFCDTKTKSGGSSTTNITYLGVVPKTSVTMGGAHVTGGYVNGVQQKEWKITRFTIYVRQDEDAENFLNSFTDPSQICPNDN